jgi:CubicO group peptidase (beta-lactamase class C family)
MAKSQKLRNYRRYEFRRADGTVIRSGVTRRPLRQREAELRREENRRGTIHHVGPAVTEGTARAWEKRHSSRAPIDAQAVRAELRARVAAEMERLHVPGVAVGILHGDTEIVETFGVTNADHPLDVDERTLFQIGSTTKTFTATALMRKVEDGALDLDAPLTSYLPDFTLANGEWAAQVTPRHLLTHTGGWDGDYLLVHPAGGRGDDALRRVVEAMPQAPAQVPPGTVFAYNNTGFSLAGRLLEVLTDRTYEDAVADLVFRPLGLDHSFFLPEEVMTHRFASGHAVRRGKATVAPLWALHRSSSAAGAIAADVPDQLRYARFHLGDGTGQDGARVLSAETMELMQSPQVEVGEGVDAVGIAWMLGSNGRTRTVAHSGGTNGQISIFQMVPGRDFALVILTNAGSGGLLIQRIARWAYEELLGLTEPEPEPVELSEDALDEYVGTYEQEMMATDVTREGAALQVQMRPLAPPKGWERAPTPPPLRAGFTAPDRLIVLDGPAKGMRATFIRNSDGDIEWLRLLSRLARRT